MRISRVGVATICNSFGICTEFCSLKANGKNRNTTIYTLSEELGLSPSTVSRALHNHPAVSAATRARVRPLAAKYNFKVHMAKLGMIVGLTDIEAIAADVVKAQGEQ